MKTVARLYTQFKPKQYDIEFDFDEDAMRFRGTVVLSGNKVGRPSKRITLHQHGLKLTHASIVKLDKKNDHELTVVRINNQKSLQEVRLHTEEMVYPGEYVLTLEFEAPLTTGMTGIYPCFFKDGDADKQLIMTQFESHHAREAFPCIDEPEAKAVFNLTLKTRTDNNYPCKYTHKEPASRSGSPYKYIRTDAKMSSYLLAFVFGELIVNQRKPSEALR